MFSVFSLYCVFSSSLFVLKVQTSPLFIKDYWGRVTPRTAKGRVVVGTGGDWTQTVSEVGMKNARYKKAELSYNVSGF